MLSLIVAVGLMMALTGCGGGEVAPKPDDKKVLKVGLSPDFAPFEYLDDQGTIVGFDVELARALGKEMGMEVQIENMGFDGLIPALQSGNIDIVMSGMAITEERKQSILFSEPYYHSGLVMVVTEESTDVQGVENLKGKKVGAQIGSTGALYAHKIDGATAKDFNQTSDMFIELKNGGIDAVVSDLPVVQYFLKSEEGKGYKIVGELLEIENTGIGIDPNQKELAEKINLALKKIKESGEYDTIYEKWFGTKPVTK